jgi:hypothetical protein
VDDRRNVVRHHNSTTLWITCVLRWRDWRQPLDQPHHWTPLFFLDEAVALAAGHRPCAFCRRADYLAYRNAVVASGGPMLKAVELDRRLADERLRRGRGFSRAADRKQWIADATSLPAGTVIVDARQQPCLVTARAIQAFSFSGWSTAEPRPDGPVAVLTPPTSVAALRGGFVPVLHPTAATVAG